VVVLRDPSSVVEPIDGVLGFGAALLVQQHQLLLGSHAQFFNFLLHLKYHHEIPLVKFLR